MSSPRFTLTVQRAVLVLMILVSTSTARAGDGAVAARTGPSTFILKAATAIDDFFSAERYSWRTNTSRLTLRGNVDAIDGRGTELSPAVKLHLALPGVRDRLRLIVNDDGDDTFSGGPVDEDESNVALRYRVRAADRSGIHFDLGASTRGESPAQGLARIGAFRHFEPGAGWAVRVENLAYRYTRSGWRNDFRLYIEQVVSDRLFLRARTRLDYHEDKGGHVLPEQRLSLFQHVDERTALAYEAIARGVFPEDSVSGSEDASRFCQVCDQYQLRVRFRRRLGHPWLFYEIWPVAAWPEQRDYDLTPVLRLRLEIVLGDLPGTTRLH